MNNDVKDLMLAKKEKINEWLEYLNSEEDDVIWIQKNRVFSTGLYNIIYQLQKIESNDFIKKQEELVNTIGQHINNRDRLKVKEIVNKLKKLDDGEKINDDIDFNNLDQMISNIDNKLEQLKQEELEGKTPEEQKQIIEQWDKEEQQFSDITNSMINSIRESTIKEIAKSVYKYLGIEINEFNVDRLEELNATIFMPKDSIRGIGGVIVGDDKTHLTCGSLHPLDYYIEEFKNGKRDDEIKNDDLGEEKINSIRQAVVSNLKEWLNFLNVEQNDPNWKSRNNLFLNRIDVSLNILKNTKDNKIVLEQIDLIKDIIDYLEKNDRENVKRIVDTLYKLTDEYKIDMIKNESISNNIDNLKQNSSNVTLPKLEYDRLRKIEDDLLKIKRCDFALIISSGAVLPVLHPNYNKDRIKIEIFGINGCDITIDGKRYIIKTQILFNKIKSLVDDNLDSLIDYSKKETNDFLNNNAYDGGISRNIKIKYGQLLISINGQLSGEIGKYVEEFIDNVKQLIIDESNLNDKDYIISNLSDDKLTKNQEDSLNDNDKIVDLLVNKIENLENGKQFSILELINLNGIASSKDINLIKISVDTLRKVQEKGIEIKPTITGIVGQPQGIPYIKVGKKDKDKEVKDYMMEFIEKTPEQPRTELDDEFDKYAKLYEEKFNKRAYIPEPSGTKEFAIECIKKCLQENRDILDELYYPNFKKDMENGILYSETKNDLIGNNKESNNHDDRKAIDFLCDNCGNNTSMVFRREFTKGNKVYARCSNCGNEISADNPFN